MRVLTRLTPQNFFESITSRGLFDQTTFASILKALRAVAHVALDLLHDFISALSKLFTFIINQVVAIFSREITSPLALGIYQLITGQKTCSIKSICALIMAVPYTLLYKAITGRSPNSNQALQDTVEGADLGKLHMSLGVVTLVETIVASVQETADVLKQWFMA